MATALTVTEDARAGGRATILALSGRLDAEGAGRVWTPAVRAAAGARGRALVLDLSAVTLCDTAGAALLRAAEAAHGAPAELRGAEAHVARLLARIPALPPAPPAARTPWRPERLLVDGARAALEGVAFLGETAVALACLPRRARMLRAGDLLRVADQAGAQAIPLVLLMGVLVGLILAFQASVQLRRFGAEVYIANLVAISLVRELGPLLAAVILAGRTGSAFAAEIGTMKVNEELAALSTMGVDPVTMLVLPRLLAAALVTPALALAMDAAGLAGMAAVMRGLGFPLAAIAAQVSRAVTVGYLAGGLFKALVFGLAVAGIGCRAGLATGIGPRAVGQSATAAVVGGIVASVVLDGLFAIVFFRLGW